MEWDIFICHASEDKKTFVRPLAEALRERGFQVWFDEFSLKVGDSLRREIDRGLASSRFGVVVLSPNFFEKEWPQKELDALVAREVSKEQRILPVWHCIEADQIRLFSPQLADRVATSSQKGLQSVLDDLLRAMGEPATQSSPKAGRHDLTLDLQESSLPEDVFDEYHYRAAMEADNVVGDYVSMLERDRSQKAVQTLFDIANLPNPWGDASCGIGGLARIGRGAIPQILALLRSEEPLRALTMLDSVMRLGDYVDIERSNAVRFLKMVVSSPQWSDVLDHLELKCGELSGRDDFRKKCEKYVTHLRAASE